MGKNALCIRRADFDTYYDPTLKAQPIGNAIWGFETVLADRDQCETDESLLQLIPYMVLRDESGDVFWYSRGTGSEEERLRAKLSIGVGGHIDAPIPDGYSLQEWVHAEAARELKEEVGVQSAGGFLFDTLLSDFSDPVGRVHLGLLTTFLVMPHEVQEMEPGIVDRGGFRSTGAAWPLSRFENWSQIALFHIAPGVVDEQEA